MKNRLIYTLIGLMIVSLIGIISIQTIWISGAIVEREQDFSAHINDALNKVNDDIDQDETEFIIRRQFGDVDSLIEEIVFLNDDKPRSGDRVMFLDDGNESKIQIDISNTRSIHDSMEHLHAEMEVLHSTLKDAQEDIEEVRATYEFQVENIDSISERIQLRQFKEAKAHHISSMIDRFTFEKFLNGELKNRISNKDLKEKLRKALKKEGIYSGFEYAVLNKEKEDYEDGFISKGFNKKKSNENFTKALFPSDKRKENQFELIVQCKNKSGYIWSGVQQMAILSGVFTILILFSFGYALYFIFKQKKISQIKTDFINNMTHELKTPLASISLASSSIKHPEVITKPEEILKYTSIIESEKDRINSHIERVLDIATLDKGDLKLDVHDTDLISIVQSSINNVNLSLTEIGGTCVFKTDLDAAPLAGDEFHLINVINNILDNSIKYSSDPLKIDVELTKTGSNYILTISDNGIGMSLKEQKLAFDKFYRAETGNIHNRKGFGLGLSYVKGIISQHKGSVKLQSQKNSGTTLTINIPASHE